MKIAIISPSPVPFTIGGIENLSWGLCEAINQLPDHYCELIKLPSRELEFWDLIHNYYNFYHLDVSHFDRVICMKYPAWMVQHEHCIIYMAHCLRGLYDTYENQPRPLEVEPGNSPVDSILQYMEEHARPETLEPFFQMLFSMEEKGEIPEKYLGFPGPLIRKIVHYFDAFAFSHGEKKQFYSISETVKNRWEYFPVDAKVQVAYPPTTIRERSAGEYRYLFVVSRLDRPKRLDMLIRAMHYVTSDIKLYIGGTGPMESELKQLAKGDSRIEFLGYVSDEEIGRWYADSMAIPYFPYDEDYGLITIEAMLHKKPVITTADAGGPTEFVVDQETGFITALGEREIAAKIDYLATHPEEARRMGEQAYKRVKDINWEGLAKQLLQGKSRQEGIERKKITVATTFPIYPPIGGGQVRLYQLYKVMADRYDVDFLSFTAAWKPSLQERIGPNLREVRVSKSNKHQLGENALKQEMQMPIGDVAMFQFADQTEEYVRRFQTSVADSQLVVLPHPYLYPVLKKYIGDKPFIYEAQDVEYLIKKQTLPEVEQKNALLEQIYEAEKLCCEESQVIMACSELDKEKLCELYHIDRGKVMIVPNGVDLENTEYVTIPQRLEHKKLLGMENETIGLFMGSEHKPNCDACEYILEIAEDLPETTFLVMGSLCTYFKVHAAEYRIPPNVGMLGLVTEEEKKRVFSAVDFALNPMTSGSGTNLKLFDYMAAGIPVISTEFGTRGVEQKDCFLIASLEDMPETIKNYKLEEQAERIKKARKLVEQEFSWTQIGEKALEEIEKRISKK